MLKRLNGSNPEETARTCDNIAGASRSGALISGLGGTAVMVANKLVGEPIPIDNASFWVAESILLTGAAAYEVIRCGFSAAADFIRNEDVNSVAGQQG